MNIRSVVGELEPYVAGRSVAGGIKLASNENPFGPSPNALRVIKDAAAQLHRYPDGSAASLRRALAESWNVDAATVILGNGSDEILVLLAAALVEPGRNCVTGATTFSQYAFATRIFGGEVRTVPMPDGRFDLGSMAERSNSDTRIIFLCNPNSPTGTIFSHDELVLFLDSVNPDTVVVVDEAYGEFVDDPAYPDTLQLLPTYPNLIRLRTFSKIYGLAGLRIGYGIGSSMLIDALSRVRQPFNVGSIAQAAALAALDDEIHYRRTLQNNVTGRERLYKIFGTRNIPYYESHANFVCAQLGRRTEEIVGKIEEKGVTIRPLASFGLPEHVRVTVGTREELDRFEEALESALAAVGRE